MPIVITPSGEYVDSVTGNPVQMTTPPMDNMAQRLSQGLGQPPKNTPGFISVQEMDALMRQRTGATQGEELQSDFGGAMARENIPPNLDMGMDSMMPQNIDPRSVVREGERAAAELSDVEKVRMLIDTGLNPQEAMEAIARELSLIHI